MSAPHTPATNRDLASRKELDALSFDDRGLVPVVAQDAGTGAVLMVAWANREALDRTLETGEVHFWSRSRRSLWRKGETSGHTLTLRSLHADCDRDTVLALVEPAGPACHTGEPTCFGQGALPEAAPAGAKRTATDPPDPLNRLRDILDQRAHHRPPESYTTLLLADENLRLKKLGEETAELIAALARDDEERATEEAADLVYHLLVALRARNVTLDDIRAALAERGSSK